RKGLSIALAASSHNAISMAEQDWARTRYLHRILWLRAPADQYAGHAENGHVFHDWPWPFRPVPVSDWRFRRQPKAHHIPRARGGRSHSRTESSIYQTPSPTSSAARPPQRAGQGDGRLWWF